MVQSTPHRSDQAGCSRRRLPGSAAAGVGLFDPASLLAAGSLVQNPQPVSAASGGKLDIGACRSVGITCVSEDGWPNNEIAAGGRGVDRREAGWTVYDTGGNCSLLEIEGLDGRRTRLLIDVGRDKAHTRRRLAETGVDRMLAAGSIDALFLTREDVDHLFGLEAVLELRRDIPIYIPASLDAQACRPRGGADLVAARTRHAATHTGKLIQLRSGGVNPIAVGVVAATFDVPILLQIESEQSLYANVQGQGPVVITGRGRQGLPRLMQFAGETLAAMPAAATRCPST